jgi:hypothetical protein
MCDVSLDIESLSLRPDCVILSIGAVKFNRLTPGDLGESFYAVLEVNEQIAKRDISVSTQEWWAKQSPEARRVLTDTKVSVRKVLHDFTIFLGDGAKPWGKGSNFDIAAIEHIYDQYDIPRPWKYTDTRCLRTLIEEFGVPEDMPVTCPSSVAHNALEDAKFQALWAQNIFYRLDKGISYVEPN